MNGFPLHLEIYDSKIIVRDENLNSIMITKNDENSIVLIISGFFPLRNKLNMIFKSKFIILGQNVILRQSLKKELCTINIHIF